MYVHVHVDTHVQCTNFASGACTCNIVNWSKGYICYNLQKEMCKTVLLCHYLLCFMYYFFSRVSTFCCHLLLDQSSWAQYTTQVELVSTHTVVHEYTKSSLNTCELWMVVKECPILSMLLWLISYRMWMLMHARYVVDVMAVHLPCLQQLMSS